MKKATKTFLILTLVAVLANVGYLAVTYFMGVTGVKTGPEILDKFVQTVVEMFDFSALTLQSYIFYGILGVGVLGFLALLISAIVKRKNLAIGMSIVFLFAALVGAVDFVLTENFEGITKLLAGFESNTAFSDPQNILLLVLYSLGVLSLFFGLVGLFIGFGYTFSDLDDESIEINDLGDIGLNKQSSKIFQFQADVSESDLEKEPVVSPILLTSMDDDLDEEPVVEETFDDVDDYSEVEDTYVDTIEDEEPIAFDDVLEPEEEVEFNIPPVNANNIHIADAQPEQATQVTPTPASPVGNGTAPVIVQYFNTYNTTTPVDAPSKSNLEEMIEKDNEEKLTSNDIKELIKNELISFFSLDEECTCGEECTCDEECTCGEECASSEECTCGEECSCNEDSIQSMNPEVIERIEHVETAIQELPTPLTEDEVRTIISDELSKFLSDLRNEYPTERHVFVEEEPVTEEIIEEVVAEEEPIIEEVIIEEVIIEEEIIEEEPVVEEPVTEEVVEEPVTEEVVEKPVVETVESAPKKEYERIPFTTRIQQADKDMIDNFNELKNEIMSYGLKSRVSNSGDTFRLHTVTYCKITIAGKSLKLYFALNPEDYKDSPIPVIDVSDKDIYKEIPLAFKVKSELSMRRAKDLIASVMERNNFEQEKVEPHDWVKDIAEEYPAK